MYLLQITFANACHKPPKALITVTKTGLLQSGQCTGVHGHGAGCKLHGPTYQIFIWRGADLESVELKESRRPLAEGVPCPPPPKKIKTPIFPQFGACPDFLVGAPSETAAGVCPENFGSPPSQKIRTPFFLQFRGVSRFFFSGHPLKPQRERVPKISGNPPLRGRVQGAEGLQVFSGAVSSDQLKYAVHIPRNFSHVTAGNLIFTCTKCPRQINCDVATSCYLLIQNNKNRKCRWIILNGLLNVLILATGFDFQNGKEQF